MAEPERVHGAGLWVQLSVVTNLGGEGLNGTDDRCTY